MKKPITFILLLFATSLWAQNRWEGIVYAEDEWTYLDGNNAPDSQWKLNSFDDSSWKKGRGGLGYGDSDDYTTVEQTTVLYSRINFEVIDISMILSAIIHTDYDDGILIYLNGHEIVRAGVEGENPDYTTLATANHEARMYKGANPEMFVLDNEELESILVRGTNTLAVEVHNVTASSSDMSSIVYFSVETSSVDSLYRPTPSWFFKPELISSTLPLIVINTDETISKAAKVTARMKIINHTDGGLNYDTDPGDEYDGFIGIEIRGNQSSNYDQKPYSIETRDSLGENNNVPLFGLPKENDWNLINNQKDKTCINHALGYEISRQMGFWAANTRHCEVIINGEPKGIYVFMESLKVDDGRVDIAKLKPEEITEPDVTGGYIFKVDYYEEDLSDSWMASYQPPQNSEPVHFVYHTPAYDEIVPEQKEYIQGFITEFEDELYDNDFANPQAGYRAYINVPSFINYLLVTEVAMNGDGYKKSNHYHKDKDRDNVRSLLNAGPIWDMDWAFRDIVSPENNSKVSTGLVYLRTLTVINPTPVTWMPRLMDDPQFANEVRTTYMDLRQSVLSQDYLMSIIDSIADLIKPSLQRHYEVWYNEGDNAESLYLQEVALLKTFLTNRLVYLEEHLPGEIIAFEDFLPSPTTYTNTTGINELTTEYSDYQLHPNPCRTQLNIVGAAISDVRLYAISGTLVMHYTSANVNELSLDVSLLNAGLYIIQITNNVGQVLSQKLQIID